MSDPLKLFVLAGEPSGDRLAADLVRQIRSRVPIELSGVGGSELSAAGLTSLFPMSELAVMGWADVLPRLPGLLWRARQVARHIVRTKPDVAVFVDAQVFSAVVARSVRRRRSAVPMILYVAPAVWAWKPERAVGLRGIFDEILAVLPFEPAVMERLGGPETHYAGHPAVADVPARVEQPKRGPLLLLPGSREGELRRHLPLMRAVAERFASHPAVEGFILPTPAALHHRVAQATSAWRGPVAIAADETAKRDAFGRAVAAVAVTGTVTLELALAGVPMVTTYVADRGQAKRWAHYAIRFAALPNILLDRPLVPEILGLEPQPSAVSSALEKLLAGDAASLQLAGFGEIRKLMREGASGAPPVNAAERVLARAPSQRRSAIGT